MSGNHHAESCWDPHSPLLRISPTHIWSIPEFSVFSTYSADQGCGVIQGPKISCQGFSRDVTTGADNGANLLDFVQSFVDIVGNSCQNLVAGTPATTVVSITQAVTITKEGQSSNSFVEPTQRSSTSIAPSSKQSPTITSTSATASSPSTQIPTKTSTLTIEESSISSSLPSASASSSSGAHSDIKLGVGIGASIGILILVFLIIIIWRQERRLKPLVKSETDQRKGTIWRDTWIPWLQKKDELDAEEQRRNELEAIGTEQELEANTVPELPTKERRQSWKSKECVDSPQTCLVRSPSSAVRDLVAGGGLTRSTGIGRFVELSPSHGSSVSTSFLFQRCRCGRGGRPGVINQCVQALKTPCSGMKPRQDVLVGLSKIVS